MAKTVKLSDIAEIVGVSTVSVSKALSDQKGVSEELREQIRKVAEELGYRKSRVETVKPTAQGFHIGVLIEETFLDTYASFYWQLYQAVATHALTKDCFTMLEVIAHSKEDGWKLPKIILEKKVDGLIIIGRMETEFLDHLQETSDIPLLFLDFYDQRHNCDSVVSNGFYGTYTLTNFLFSMGHRRIGYVGTLLATASITDRYLGYVKSLMEHGVEIQKQWLIEDRDLNESRIDPLHKLKLPKDLPGAFVCNCDLTASYLIRKLREAGYRVPQDISVVGFDNYLYPGLCELGITTYEVDVQEMARVSVDRLIRKMAGDVIKPSMIIVDGHLIHKDSVARVINPGPPA